MVPLFPLHHNMAAPVILGGGEFIVLPRPFSCTEAWILIYFGAKQEANWDLYFYCLWTPIFAILASSRRFFNGFGKSTFLVLATRYFWLHQANSKICLLRTPWWNCLTFLTFFANPDLFLASTLFLLSFSCKVKQKDVSKWIPWICLDGYSKTRSWDHGVGFFYSKGTWGCAAFKGILFRTSSLAKGKFFRNFGPATV